MIEVKETWKFQTDEIVRDVAISKDGEYVVIGSADRNVYFVNRNGELIWKYEAKHSVESVFLNETNVAIGSKDRNIYFFDLNGKLLWRYPTTGSIWKVLISEDRNFVAGASDDKKIHLLTKEGKLIEDYLTEERITDFTISENAERIVFGCYDKTVYFIDKKGNLLWDFEMEGFADCISLTKNAENIVIGSNDRNIYYLSKDGKLLWKNSPRSRVWVLSLTEDKIVAGLDSKAIVLNKRGKVLWQHPTEFYDVKGIDISQNDYIVVGSRQNKVQFFNERGEILWEFKIEKWIENVAISKNGECIIAGSIDRWAYFFDNFKIVHSLLENTQKLIEDAKEYGADSYEAESLVQKAKDQMTYYDYTNAFETIFLAETSAKDLKSKARPEISLKLVANDRLKFNAWNMLSLFVRNNGNAIAENILIKMHGEGKVRGLTKYISLRTKEEMELPIGIRPMISGILEMKITVSYQDHQGKEFSTDSLCYINVAKEDEEIEEDVIVERKFPKFENFKKEISGLEEDIEITPFFIQRIDNNWLVCPFCILRIRNGTEEEVKCRNCGRIIE